MTNLPIQLISTDFDGTLFAEFENPPVPHKLQLLIGRLQRQGVKWVINTGRDLSGLMEAIGRAQLTVKPDFLVLVEREIYCHQDSRYVAVPEWNDRCDAAHATLFARVRTDVARLTAWVNQRFAATVYEDPWSPFCIIAERLDDADAIHEFMEEYSRSVPELSVVRNDVYARFSHSGFNKGTALSEIARQLGIGAERILAAGDHFNDLPMLSARHAQWLVAPGNAIDEVKAVVRKQNGYVSHHTHGHGVADGLEFHFKNAGFGEA